jgi:aspartyl/asparaginyl beta-hydroxylase (cupin superfamily)
LIGRFCADASQVFFDPAMFAWTPRIEALWPTIRAELDQLLNERDRLPGFEQISRRQRRIATGGWKVFFFNVYGREVRASAQLCPATAAVLRTIPGLRTAMFSILKPWARIPPHSGHNRGVLRYHLGLRVPHQDRCGIRVKDSKRQWAEGKSLVFDDTFEHEVWNDSDEDRVVLFVDILRPLPWPLHLLNILALEVIKRFAPDVDEAYAQAQAFSADLESALKMRAESARLRGEPGETRAGA